MNLNVSTGMKMRWPHSVRLIFREKKVKHIQSFIHCSHGRSCIRVRIMSSMNSVVLNSLFLIRIPEIEMLQIF